MKFFYFFKTTTFKYYENIPRIAKYLHKYLIFNRYPRQRFCFKGVYKFYINLKELLRDFYIIPKIYTNSLVSLKNFLCWVSHLKLYFSIKKIEAKMRIFSKNNDFEAILKYKFLELHQNLNNMRGPLRFFKRKLTYIAL